MYYNDSVNLEQRDRLFNVYVGHALKAKLPELTDTTKQFILAVTSMPRSKSYMFVMHRADFQEYLRDSFMDEFKDELDIDVKTVLEVTQSSLKSLDEFLAKDPDVSKVPILHIMIAPRGNVATSTYCLMREVVMTTERLKFTNLTPEKAVINKWFSDKILEDWFEDSLTSLKKFLDQLKIGQKYVVYTTDKELNMLPATSEITINAHLEVFSAHLLEKVKQQNIEKKLNSVLPDDTALIVFIVKNYDILYPIFIEFNIKSRNWKAISCCQF